jgi:hypothetical protein
MPPPSLTQLPLPLLLDDIPLRIGPPPKPSVQPKVVWQTIDQGEQARIRLIWLRVMEEVSDEHR